MSLELQIAPELAPYVADATVRFRYLHPGVEVTLHEGRAAIVAHAAVNIRDLEQQFMFCLYRQKIYSETLPLRRTLLAGVTGR